MKCSICKREFDFDGEGGTRGYIGDIPVAFCPTCFSGISDMCDYEDYDKNKETINENGGQIR